VKAALHLPARVFDDPALGPLDEAPTNSALRVWAEIMIAGIDVSPSKPGMGSMKLSKACEQAYNR
jgi:hypothetical protein